MKKIMSVFVSVCMIFSLITVNSASAISPVSDGAGWKLDFSSAEDGATVPFTLTNATAQITEGILKVTTTAKGPRLVYNDTFSVNASEIEKIVIVQRTASGKYFQPYLYFGGTFSGTNVFKSKAIPGTGDWQEIVIDTHNKTVKTGTTNCTGSMPEGLNWSGTITAFRLDNSSQSSDFEIQSIKFLKFPVDGEAVGKGWTIDFSSAEDGALFAGTLRNASAAVNDGALTFTPSTTDPGLTSSGTSFAVNAGDVGEIRIKAKLPAGAGVQLFYTPSGGTIKNFGKVNLSDLKDLGDGWYEYVVLTESYADWAGDIASFRFDVDYTKEQYSIRYIKFVEGVTKYLEGTKAGNEWYMDFSLAEDGTVPVINEHGESKINTNAVYSISGGALQVVPMDSTVTAPRIAISNKSNFSVNTADITKICFKVRSEVNLSKANLYYATESGAFSSYLSAVIGEEDSDGWQDVVFYSHADESWNGISEPIAKIRFDMYLSSSAVYEVQSIKFTETADFDEYTVSFDGNNKQILKEGYKIYAPEDPVKENYTFCGWAKKGTSTPVTLPRILTEDMELVSLWGANHLVEAGVPHAHRFFKEKEPAKDYAYSFCVVGDTQVLTDSYPDKLTYIYDWIVENKEDKNIQFVFGLGDITNYSRDDEWQVAQEQINKLNGVVPYSLIRGSENHDQSAKFNEYFNKPVYTDTLEGFYEADKINNTWRTFSVGGVNYLFVMLDFGPSDAVLEWAGEVIEQHPDHRVIISTHCYLYSDGTTVDYTDQSPPHKEAVGDGTKNNGDEMWDKLISQHENIFMVLSGHISSSKIVVTKTEGVHGNIVTQMLIDPQGVDSGIVPSGMVAMLYFSEDGETVEVENYSTIQEMYYMPENQFTIDIPKYIVTPDNTTVLSYDNRNAVVYSEEAGTYSVIFADFENGVINNVEIVEATFLAGETKEIPQTVTSFTLGEGDMVMIWQDMINLTPMCEALVIE